MKSLDQIPPSWDQVLPAAERFKLVMGGVAVLDAKHSGAGLVPLDSPLISLDHPGLWQYTREFTAARPRVFVNLFNNVWGTNFAQWNGGSWTSRVRVWAIGASRYRCFPAWMASRVICRCRWVGVAMTTASRSARLNTAR